jgi:hypothetical protein
MRLPVELHLVVAQELGLDATIEDWVNLAMVCRALHDVSSVMFVAWLESQPTGHTFGRSRGTEAELVFLHRHIDGMCMPYPKQFIYSTHKELAITARKCSITFHVLQHGGTEWWMTRESGRRPPCVRVSCSRCRYHKPLQDLRQSYLVIVADHPGKRVWTEPARRVAFAQLDADALFIVACRVASTLLQVSALRTVFQSFARGMFSVSTKCVCSVSFGTCASCSACRESRFVWENGYSRVSPYGNHHWYRGVSDAVDRKSEGGAWLQCTVA